jgi:hypothetical protein
MVGVRTDVVDKYVMPMSLRARFAWASKGINVGYADRRFDLPATSSRSGRA